MIYVSQEGNSILQQLTVDLYYIKVLLTVIVYMSTLTYWSFLFLYFLYVFYAARIAYTFGCHCYLTNMNSLCCCICVHQGNISAAAGLERGTPGLRDNHATNELSWRHATSILLNEQSHCWKSFPLHSIVEWERIPLKTAVLLWVA